MNRGCFFDLDGTLVHAFPEGDTTRGPRTRDEVEILPGTAEDLWRLHEADYSLIVVTNQPGLARGEFYEVQCREIQQYLQTELPILEIYTCPHQGDWCACRKPRAGLIIQAAVEHELDLTRCWLVGDRETDREAAIQAGIPERHAMKIVTNQGIGDATEWILANSK